MSSISTTEVVKAARRILSSDTKAQAAILDSIYEVQPHILLTTLALSQDGVSSQKLGHALHILMVVHLAIQDQTHPKLEIITKEDIADAYQKNESMFLYLEKEPDKEMWKLTVTEYPEQNLLAYVFGYLKDEGIIPADDESCKVALICKVILHVYTNKLPHQNRARTKPGT